jgi:hypothetical protein
MYRNIEIPQQRTSNLRIIPVMFFSVNEDHAAMANVSHRDSHKVPHNIEMPYISAVIPPIL